MTLGLGSIIRLTPEELSKTAPYESLALADGSGFIAELGVYHHLHCIVSTNEYLPNNAYL